MMYAYHISPMDFGWYRMPTIKQTVQTILANCSDDLMGFEEDARSIIRLLELYELALDRAKMVGWEGDFRSETQPRVVLLPAENEPITIFVWKQDNNGSTFVVSPIPLPHLQSLVDDILPPEAT